MSKLYLTGYTPYPLKSADDRLPHIARKLDAQIHKTALDAETLVPWEQQPDVFEVISGLRNDGYTVAAVEQTSGSIALPEFSPPDKIALLVGREVEGVEPEVLAVCDASLEIPMFGEKESFNVVQAAAMALYHCRFS